MDSKYGTSEVVNDATTFLKTRFGKHYIERLKAKKEDALSVSMNLELSDSYRANYATLAKAVQDELDYFEAMERIKNKPDLMKKLADVLKVKRGEAE